MQIKKTKPNLLIKFTIKKPFQSTFTLNKLAETACPANGGGTTKPKIQKLPSAKRRSG